MAFRHGLLAAMATPLQQHNPLASLVPTHRLVEFSGENSAMAERGRSSPIHMRTYIYRTKANNRHVCQVNVLFFLLIKYCGQRIKSRAHAQ